MELILVVFIILFMISVSVLVVLYWKTQRKEQVGETVVKENCDPFLRVTVQDVLKLAHAHYMEKLDQLVEETNLKEKVPAFYDDYQRLSKNSKETYFQSLLEVLCVHRQDWLSRMVNGPVDMATQDILLMLLMEEELENKNIARILFITPDALKKRKTRLKLKIEQYHIPLPVLDEGA